MKKFQILIILLILCLAVFLRVYKLENVPPSLFGDEVDVGYQAYSLLTTGKDLSGRFLPFYLRSLSEYRTPLYLYSDVPFIAIFGLNEIGVRASAAFWGVLSIIGLYLLTKKLFNWKIASFSALLMTLSPWHLQYSRAAFETTMLLTFIIFGTYLYILGLKRRYFLVPSAFIFGLSIYIYSTAVVFVPLWLLLLLAITYKGEYREVFKDKIFLSLAALILILTAIPALWSTYTGVARERFTLVSIFQDSILLDKVNVARKGQEYFNLDGEFQRIDSTFERIFHNKPLIFSQIFFHNYSNAFSPNFLFSTGDPNFRQSIFEMGELYGIESLTILLGLWFLLTRQNFRNKQSFSTNKLLVSGWLLLAPIPASLTDGGGLHATRLILMLPPLMILSGLGFFYLFDNFRKIKLAKFLSVLVVVILILEVSLYLHRYYVHYPIESWRWWHVGFKEALNFVDQNQEKYQTIVINNSYEPSLIRYLFYTKYSPFDFHQKFVTEQTQRNILPGIDGFGLGEKLIFGYLNKDAKTNGGITYFIQPKMLYVVSARDELDYDLRDNPPQNLKILKTIVNPLGQPIFYIVEGV